jgi:hypothetical protein
VYVNGVRQRAEAKVRWPDEIPATGWEYGADLKFKGVRRTAAAGPPGTWMG